MNDGNFKGGNFYPTALNTPDAAKAPVLEYATPRIEEHTRREAENASSSSWWSSIDFSPSCGDIAEIVTNIPYADIASGAVDVAGNVGGFVVEGAGAIVGSIFDGS